jgi:hypothetical protein
VVPRGQEQCHRKLQYSNPGIRPCLRMNGNATIMRKRIRNNFELFTVDSYTFGNRIPEMFDPRTDFGWRAATLVDHDGTLLFDWWVR